MDEKGCSICSREETREAALRPAARDPALKGSHFVGSRGVQDLYTCRDCGAMWRTWYDTREGFRCWSVHGQSVVPVFGADTSLQRLVSWTAETYEEGSFGLVDALATRLIRRRPEGLQEGTEALFRRLTELTPPTNALGAARLSMLYHILGLVVERAIRGDLRPDRPRVKPPTRYREAAIEEAARQFVPREVANLTRIPKTHDVIRRLMWESRWNDGPGSPDDAVVVIHDFSPLLNFLTELPLKVVREGVLRGVIAATAFKATSKLHNLGRLPENDHAIWMPREGWMALERLLDPLERLAATVLRIREAALREPSECLARLQMEGILVKEPIRYGARLTASARRELEGIADRLQGRGDIAAANDELRAILDLEKAAAAADERCVLSKE